MPSLFLHFDQILGRKVPKLLESYSNHGSENYDKVHNIWWLVGRHTRGVIHTLEFGRHGHGLMSVLQATLQARSIVHLPAKLGERGLEDSVLHKFRGKVRMG